MTEAINVHSSTIADKLRTLLPDVLFETSKLHLGRMKLLLSQFHL